MCEAQRQGRLGPLLAALGGIAASVRMACLPDVASPAPLEGADLG